MKSKLIEFKTHRRFHKGKRMATSYSVAKRKEIRRVEGSKIVKDTVDGAEVDNFTSN